MKFRYFRQCIFRPTERILIRQDIILERVKIPVDRFCEPFGIENYDQTHF